MKGIIARRELAHHRNHSCQIYVRMSISLYSVTPFERPPPLERPHFWCKRNGLIRGVPLYFEIADVMAISPSEGASCDVHSYSQAEAIQTSIIIKLFKQNFNID